MVKPDVVKRNSGSSNKAMLEYCEILKRVVTATKEVKIGRGKTVEVIKVLKHNTEPEIIERIVRSCNYYKQLHEQDMKREEDFKLRDYQVEITKRAVRCLDTHRFVYLAMQVRTGKTYTALNVAEEMRCERVLFVTKKKAVGSIVSDYNTMKPSFYACIVNYESVHKVMDDWKWDLIILDEAHGMGAFPKPSNRAKIICEIIKRCKPYVILMSGTPTPESYSQMYHQVYAIQTNPFSEFKNFYRFCDKYVKVKTKMINGLAVKDYSNGLESIVEAMSPYMINYTQSQAGFESVINENVLEVEMSDMTKMLISKLKKHKVITGSNEVILGDTPVKLMMKIHQLSSGTIKFESGNSKVIDTSKAEFIKDYFEGYKIGIFYKFKEEFNALKSVFGDSLTDELSVFKDTDKNIALQIVSGREGLSLKEADYLVYYNIDFSATSYWQSRDRMTTMDRKENDVYWIFSKDGIEHDIYNTVSKKKDYTVNHFKKLLKK